MIAETPAMTITKYVAILDFAIALHNFCDENDPHNSSQPLDMV